MNIVAFLIVLLHGYAWLEPSGLNWGVHFLAFAPTIVSIAMLAVMLAVLNPGIQARVLSAISRITAFISSRSKVILSALSLLALVLLASLFWFGRQNIPFLGDGFLVFKQLPELPAAHFIAQSTYYNEPGSALVFYYVYELLPKIGINILPLQTYQVVSIAFGLGTIVLFWFVVKICSKNTLERALGFLFLLVLGGSQLFFGYIEDYAPLYWGITFFTLASVLYLQEKISLIFAGAAFALLFLLHLGALIIFPALLYVFFISIRRRQFVPLFFAIIVMLALIAGGLHITGYTPQGIIDHFGTASQVSFFAQDPMTKSYEWYSPYHILDIVNLLTLISPFALPVLLIVGIFQFNRELIKEHESIFLIITAACGLAFVSGVNSLLGMSRDWDLFSSFCVPLCIVSIYLWNRSVADETIRRRFMIVMVVVTLLHTIPWLVVNAKGERSYKRFAAIPDERLWSKKAMANSYDALGGYFSLHGNHREALYYYLKYYLLDSRNPRILMNIGIVYAKLEDSTKSMAFFRKAADNGSPEKEVYFWTGFDLEKQGKIDDALYYLRRGLELDSTSVGINNEVGLMLVRDKQAFDDALPYLERAIRLDSTLATPYNNAAICYLILGDTVRMNYCIDKYRQLKPDDLSILRLRAEARRKQ
jgi:tetratricopeptide (TPR) repeat protein